MRKSILSSWMGILGLMLALSACAPSTAPDDASTDADGKTQLPPPSAAPAATEDPTLQPVVLSGPEMALGSTFSYVDGSTLVAVPAGPFTMGREGGTDNPAHLVTLDDFWIYQSEVTNRQYSLCVAAGECAVPDLQDDLTYDDPLHANDPLVGVTWDQAGTYCGFVHARLPTEPEWEKTARGPDANLDP